MGSLDAGGWNPKFSPRCNGLRARRGRCPRVHKIGKNRLHDLLKRAGLLVEPKQGGSQGYYKVWVSETPIKADE